MSLALSRAAAEFPACPGALLSNDAPNTRKAPQNKHRTVLTKPAICRPSGLGFSFLCEEAVSLSCWFYVPFRFMGVFFYVGISNGVKFSIV